VYRLESMIAKAVKSRSEDAHRNSFADVCALYTRALGTVRELKQLYGSEDKPVAAAAAPAGGTSPHALVHPRTQSHALSVPTSR
jgi:hypothetical protein